MPESVLLWPVVCSSSVHELSELEESEPCTRFFCGFTPGFSFPIGAFKSNLLSRRLSVISCRTGKFSSEESDEELESDPCPFFLFGSKPGFRLDLGAGNNFFAGDPPFSTSLPSLLMSLSSSLARSSKGAAGPLGDGNEIEFRL